jgi:phosphate starvation-inducible protein PhoH/intein/homing endonuclease
MIMSNTTTSTVTLESSDEALRLFGSRDQYLRMIRDALGVRLIARGDKIQIDGPEAQVGLADRVFAELRQMLRQSGKLSAEDVRTVLAVVQGGGDRQGPQKLAVVEGSGRFVRPRTDGQARYAHAMRENDLVFCIGPAGTGKCVAADTLVLTGEGLVPIGELARDTDQGEYRERPTEVYGVNGPAQGSHVYNGGVSQTVRIRTRHGLALEGTLEHPVLTLGPAGEPQWLPLGQVRPGAFVAVARGTNLFGKEVAVDFQYRRSPADRCSRPVTLDRLDPEIGYFLGLLVGDGCMRARDRVILTAAAPPLREAFEKVLARWSLHWFPNPGRPYDMVVASRQLHHLLLHLGLSAKLAHEKEVPACVLRAPREIVVAFLQGLFDTDGTVDRRDGYPSLATSSPALAHQVQLLLLNLGVVARLRSKRTLCRTAYLLDIRGEEASHFVEAVGFRLECKAELVRRRLRNPNLDLVPHVAHLINAVVREHSFSRAIHKKFWDYRIGRRVPSYSKLAGLLTHFHRPHPGRERLEWLLETHFLWSEVTEVEAGTAQVYDLTVPEGHSFVAGGIVNHNTYLAVGMAVSMLRQAQAKRIVLVRPAVEAGERLGFLPGDIVAKVNPYLRPLFDALNDMMEPEQVKRYMENDIIEIVPLAYMRGRTLNQAVIILDEGQNTTVAQMRMFLTRMGNGSKIIVTGDVTQVDLPRQTRSGLIDAAHRLRDLERIAIIHLGEQDIVRHPLVQQIVRAYEDDKPRKKKE